MKNGMNPYMPSWEFVPDGEPHLFGDRVYVYGSHDHNNGWVFCQDDYVCWSAPANDLTDWRFEGVIYPRNADPANADGSMNLYAPDVQRGPDGRYYLYYVFDHEKIVAVAVCDKPAGRYQFYGHVHYPDGTLLGERDGDEPQFDPGVLEEDGVLYLVTGFSARGNTNSHGAMLTELDSDMLTIRKAPRFIVPGCEYAKGTSFAEHPFFEAPSLRKINGKYYFVYSSTAMHELCYAVSDSMRGNFSFGGVLVSNCDLGIASYKSPNKPVTYAGNNHGSILTVGNSHYIFYHRHTAGTWFCRQACAELLPMNEDGSFPQAEITSQGLTGQALPAEGEYSFYHACYLFTDDNEHLTGQSAQPRIVYDGDSYVTGIRKSTTIGFNAFRYSGRQKLTLWARGYSEGLFEVRTELDGPVLARIQLSYTNMWTAYTVEADFPTSDGRLFLTYTNPNGDDPIHAILQVRSICFESAR